MKEPTQSSLLYDELQATSNKIARDSGNDSRYSVRFTIINGIIGLLCLVSAIALTISGTVGLRDYGFSNEPLIAGIVLFGVGSVLIIVACVAAKPTQSIVLYNEPQPTPKKIDKLRGGDGSYSGRFTIISATLGFLCLIPAIALTFTGAAGLGNGGDNGRLVSGIVLFAVAITLIILAILTCCLK
ncbi:unnamed protein product [Rotaria sp. Silwood1]|nr:unnamed protein product [Rotaria sp. Silwood1]